MSSYQIFNNWDPEKPRDDAKDVIMRIKEHNRSLEFITFHQYKNPPRIESKPAPITPTPVATRQQENLSYSKYTQEQPSTKKKTVGWGFKIFGTILFFIVAFLLIKSHKTNDKSLFDTPFQAQQDILPVSKDVKKDLNTQNNLTSKKTNQTVEKKKESNIKKNENSVKKKDTSVTSEKNSNSNPISDAAYKLNDIKGL